MKKVLDKLKQYLLIAFIFSVIIITCLIVKMVRSNTLPTIDLLYIIKIIFSIMSMTLGLIIGIAMLDFCLIYCAKSLFKDFKYADKSGRITIIIVCIVVLLQKIGEWTR